MMPVLMYMMYARQNEPVSIKSVHYVYTPPFWGAVNVDVFGETIV